MNLTRDLVAYHAEFHDELQIHSKTCPLGILRIQNQTNNKNSRIDLFKKCCRYTICKKVASSKHLLVWSVMDEVPDDPQQ